MGLKDFFARIFCSELRTMNAWEILLAVLISALLVYIAYRIIKVCVSGVKTIWKKSGGKVKITPKQRCAKVQCRHCGRMLDKCACQKMQGKSYFYRLRAYKKETKALAAEQARRELERQSKR